MVELYLLKGKILKHMNKKQEAYDAVSYAA